MDAFNETDVLPPQEETEWLPGAGNYGYFSRIECSLVPNQVPTSCLCFDPLEELLWCGSFNGKVSSYFHGTGYEKYTSFFVSPSDVRALEVCETGVLSLTATALKANTRQGLHVFHHTSGNMKNLTQMHNMTNLPGRLVLGGDQQSLIQLDVETQKELRISFFKETDCSGIRSTPAAIFTSDSEGNITMRSSQSMETLRVLPKAHGGPISDFDICGNKMITCGSSLRVNSMHGDPYVKVYDLRNFQAQKPLALSFAPIFTRFIPTFYDSRVLLCSELGQAQVCDIRDGGVGAPLLIESDGYALSSIAISTHKQMLAFGDEIGVVHVYADRHNPTVNETSFETEFADPTLGLPHSFNIDDTQTPYASVPLPFCMDEHLLSDWPEDLCQPTYRTPKPFGPHANLRTIQFVGYASNPRSQTPFRFFNVVPYVIDEKDTPKVVEDKFDDQPHVVPQFYRKLKISKSSRPLPNDSGNLLALNKTTVVPLESSHNNLSVNCILQILYHSQLFKQFMIAHICEEEHCIACQLGFLFRMLKRKTGSSMASSKNLLRSMAALGFSSQLSGKIPDIHSTLNFLLNTTKSNLKDGELATFTELFGTVLAVNSRCVRCSDIFGREDTTYMVKLQYPKASEHLTFASLIEKALHARGQVDDTCPSCKVKARIEETRKVKSLAPLLIVDTNSGVSGFYDFWNTQLRMTERRPRYKRPEKESSLSGGVKGERPCRYGLDCRNRPYCKYTHGNEEWETECSTWLTKKGEHWRQFMPSSFSAKITNGITILREKVSSEEEEIYVMVGMVCMIKKEDETWDHVVCVVRTEENIDLPWALINESLVTQLHTEEALHVDPRWKLPLALLYYSKNKFKEGFESQAIPASVFMNDFNLTGDEEIARERRGWKIPEKGDIIGIDAEFINVSKEHGKKSVARVSCVDFKTDNVLVDDYVVTCEGDTVHDYLTPVSGICEDDLNPTKSTKHLITLKKVYLKILHLIERGVIFVGHALNNDFSVLNIYVPPEQMIDTVQLFYQPQKRMISLQFLAWHVLGQNIQEGVHDSVEDARVAMALYKKYLEFKANNTIESVVNNLYECGENCNWRTPSKSCSPQSDECHK